MTAPPAERPEPRALRRRMLAWLVEDGRTQAGGAVFLAWDPARPLEIDLEVRGHTTWTLHRDLLLDGSVPGAEPQGVGDVIVGPGEEWGIRERVLVTLRSPDGHCVLALSRWGVRTLLAESLAFVPRGEEVVDVDACLAELLADS